MEDILNSELSPAPRFLSQWNAKERPSWALVTTEPTCTIPDQSMTIQEIIQKFTRTGLVPQSYLRTDQGGNVASDPESDPLDDWNDVHDSARVEGPEGIVNGAGVAASDKAEPPQGEASAPGDGGE